MAKFHRDSVVTSIWEGTSNIQSLEVMEVLLKRNGLEIMHKFFQEKIRLFSDRNFAGIVENKISEAFKSIGKWFNSGNPEFYAKEALFLIGNLVAVCEMELVGQSNPGGVYSKSSRIFFNKVVLGNSMDSESLMENLNVIEWMDETR